MPMMPEGPQPAMVATSPRTVAEGAAGVPPRAGTATAGEPVAAPADRGARINAHTRGFALLDGLRGVAALGVLLFHIGTRAGGPQLTPAGYLAVDFFFMLSGFVVAEAYSARLGGGAAGMPSSLSASRRLTLAGFAALRLRRMLPAAVLGTVLGGLYLLARCRAAPSLSDPVGMVVAADLLNLLIVPKLWLAPATHGELFPANGPLWSLFLELLINLAWARWAVRWSLFRLTGVTALGGLALVAFGLGHGSLDCGWNLATLPGGLARVTYGFGAGLVLHRLHLQRRLPRLAPHRARVLAVAVTVSLVVMLALPLPRLGVIVALGVVLVVLPLVLALAVMAGPAGRLPGGAWLGRISYPLYAVHVPLLAAWSGVTKYTGAHPGWQALWLVPALLAITTALEAWYEAPLRRWLAHVGPAATATRARPSAMPRSDRLTRPLP